MLIGKADGETRISYATPETIVVRGRDLCRELIGEMSFTAYFFLLVTGEAPTASQTKFLDAVLVSIAEHGLVPNVVASRMTFAAEPTALQAAVAAGLLGCGSVVLGTSQAAGILIRDALAEADRQAEDLATIARSIVARHRTEGRRLPGFGHPLHHPVDPRAQRLFELADHEGVAGRSVAFARALEAAVNGAGGKPLPMNVSMAIPAVLLDIGFPLSVMRGIPLLARTASLIAHLAEETEHPIGFLMAHHAESNIPFTGERIAERSTG
jgi:citrate synthase